MCVKFPSLFFAYPWSSIVRNFFGVSFLMCCFLINGYFCFFLQIFVPHNKPLLIIFLPVFECLKISPLFSYCSKHSMKVHKCIYLLAAVFYNLRTSCTCSSVLASRSITISRFKRPENFHQFCINWLLSENQVILTTSAWLIKHLQDNVNS